MKKFVNGDKMGFDIPKLATFVRVIEKGYDPKNPYHNRLASHPTSCWAIYHFSFPTSPLVCLCYLLIGRMLLSQAECGLVILLLSYWDCLSAQGHVCLSVCLSVAHNECPFILYSVCHPCLSCLSVLHACPTCLSDMSVCEGLPHISVFHVCVFVRLTHHMSRICLTLVVIPALPCSTHVASVVQMTHLLLQQAGVAKIMSEPQVYATYYAALTHDFEHLGVNNDYLIKSFHPLAVMYNDISPLENHHLAAAVRVMQRPECRFIKVC